jgi:quinol monooxygenase YgiN
MKYTMARYTVKPERVKEVKRALAEFVAQVHKHEPRTLYLIFREEDQHTFVHWIGFENEAEERRHSQSSYNNRLVKTLMRGCVGKPTFSEFRLCGASKHYWTLNPNR